MAWLLNPPNRRVLPMLFAGTPAKLCKRLVMEAANEERETLAPALVLPRGRGQAAGSIFRRSTAQKE